MQFISGVILDEDTLLSYEEICRATHENDELIIQLIEYQIIHPKKGSTKNNWEFDSLALKRARLACNFYHDLEVNLQGIALLIDLLERIEALERAMQARDLNSR